MRVTLPESMAGRKRNTPRAALGTLTSVVLHAVVIGGAVAGAGISEARPSGVERVDTLVYRPPPAPPPSRGPTTGRVGGLTFTGTPPVIADPAWKDVILDVTAPDFRPEGAVGPTEFTRTGASEPAPARAPIAGDSRAFDVATVEKAVVPRPGNPEPRYPTLLSQAGVEGYVVVRFVVDTLGGVERESVRVLAATHDQFSRAVREVLPRMRFTPAELGGRAVRQLVEQRFGFELRTR